MYGVYIVPMVLLPYLVICTCRNAVYIHNNLTMYMDVGGCSYMYVCIQSTVLCRA